LTSIFSRVPGVAPPRCLSLGPSVQSLGGHGKPEAYPTTSWWRGEDLSWHLQSRFRSAAPLVFRRFFRARPELAATAQGIKALGDARPPPGGKYFGACNSAGSADITSLYTGRYGVPPGAKKVYVRIKELLLPVASVMFLSCYCCSAVMTSIWKCLPFALVCLVANAGASAPGILITNLSPYNSLRNVSGLVYGTNSASLAVAVFIYVPGYGWVTKPTCAQPLTAVQPDGSWIADITTGGADPLATRIAALLVSKSYNQPCVNGSSVLSTNIYAQALASAIVTRPYPSVRWVSFSGYDWWVKSSAGLVGPGPNYFSNSTNNVWVDNVGQLHLRITNRSNQWQCAELVTARTFGYGSYRFELNSPVDNLDPNVVLGLFTWSDDPAFNYREIDIECGRWSNPSDVNNSQFVVQPFAAVGHLVRSAVPTGLTNSTHLFTWETNRITFQSQRGSFSPNPDPTNVLRNWTYSLVTPRTGDENIRINLWLNRGAAPTDKNEVEVIIKSFQFVPLEAPPAPRLTRLMSGPARLVMDSQPDRRYEFEASRNLRQWEPLGVVLATNIVVNFTNLTSAGLDQCYYRAAALP